MQLPAHGPILYFSRRTMPGVKRKETSLAIKLIKEISKEEYINGINNKRAAARNCC